MFDLLFAAALLQAQAQAQADPCNAAGRAAQVLAGCPTWRLMTRDGEASGHIDPASVRREGGRVELMTRMLLDTPLDGRIHSLNTRLELNCAARTRRALHNIAFDAAGRTLFTFGADDTAEAVPPGSAFATMLTEFCPR